MNIVPTDIIFTDEHKDQMLTSAVNSNWINHISHHSGLEI